MCSKRNSIVASAMLSSWWATHSYYSFLSTLTKWWGRRWGPPRVFKKSCKVTGRYVYIYTLYYEGTNNKANTAARCPLFNVPVSEAWHERMSHNPPSSLRVKYTFTCILLSCPFSGYNLTELPVQKVVLAVTSA